MCVRVDVRGRCPTKNLEVLVISCPRTWTRQHQYRSFGRLKGWSTQSLSYNDPAPPGPLTCTWRYAHDSISQLQAIKNWRWERPGNTLGTVWEPGYKIMESSRDRSRNRSLECSWDRSLERSWDRSLEHSWNRSLECSWKCEYTFLWLRFDLNISTQSWERGTIQPTQSAYFCHIWRSICHSFLSVSSVIHLLPVSHLMQIQPLRCWDTLPSDVAVA